MTRKKDLSTRTIRLSRSIMQQCDQEELVVVMTALCHVMLNIINETSPSEKIVRDAVETTCCMLVAGMDEMLKDTRETMK